MSAFKVIIMCHIPVTSKCIITALFGACHVQGGNQAATRCNVGNSTLLQYYHGDKNDGHAAVRVARERDSCATIPKHSHD